MRPPVEYHFIAPDGKEYRGSNVRQFARKHGLDEANMQHVHLGERRHHKGWRAADESLSRL
jgi:hypothetical protein